jgi:hypothetical protein
MIKALPTAHSEEDTRLPNAEGQGRGTISAGRLLVRTR